jgi:zinc/manganese transport system substrate-binding protein
MNDPRLIQMIAKETGAQMGGELFSDALSKADGPAPTYPAMFRNNVPRLKAAMLKN